MEMPCLLASLGDAISHGHHAPRLPAHADAAARRLPGDAAAVAALAHCYSSGEIVIYLGMRDGEGEGEDRTRTRLGSRVVRAPVSDFAMQKTPVDNQNALHLAAGPGEERLAFVVAFLDLVGFETGMHLAMARQRDGVSPAWRARQNKHRHVVELYEPLQRGDRASFMATTRRGAPPGAIRVIPQSAGVATDFARKSWHREVFWVHIDAAAGRRDGKNRAPVADSSDGDDGDVRQHRVGPVIPALRRRVFRALGGL